MCAPVSSRHPPLSPLSASTGERRRHSPGRSIVDPARRRHSDGRVTNLRPMARAALSLLSHRRRRRACRSQLFRGTGGGITPRGPGTQGPEEPGSDVPAAPGPLFGVPGVIQASENPNRVCSEAPASRRRISYKALVGRGRTSDESMANLLQGSDGSLSGSVCGICMLAMSFVTRLPFFHYTKPLHHHSFSFGLGGIKRTQHQIFY